MDLQVLKYFYEVAKVGNISYAAYNLKVTQPTITKQLKLLEEEVEQTLYTRKSKGIELTEAGEILKEKAEELLSIEQETITKLKNLSGKTSGTIRIACLNNIIRKDLANAITCFNTIYPNIKFRFKSGDMDYINYDSNHGISDIAIGFYPPNESNIIYTHLELRLGILMSINDKIKNNANINTSELYSLPLIAPKRSTISSLLEQHGIHYDDLNIHMEFDDPQNYLGLIQIPGRYVLCHEPSKNILKSNLFCFKPLSPEITSIVGIKCSNNEDRSLPRLFLMYLQKCGIFK